jgi:peptidoglycan/xylan/chitin deacetylase (PgdA/CDA1 family)
MRITTAAEPSVRSHSTPGLFSPVSLFYLLKPLIPRSLQIALRRARCRRLLERHRATWPVDPGGSAVPDNWPGWPDGKRFALVLTHDVEGTRGVERTAAVAALEQSRGLRSSFNFVGRDYPVPARLRSGLCAGGFEIGVHGLHHNGLMYLTPGIFRRHARGIRQCLAEWNAVGFRSPAMHHDFDAIHELGVRYDSSTFDTDPFEPQPDGVRTIFPVWIVNRQGTSAYVELPYTLPQDFTLYVILGETDNAIWKRKLDWLAEHGGMALMDTHPDYMCPDGEKPGREEYPVRLYQDFLDYVCTRYQGQFWAALPREVAGYFGSVYPRETAVRKAVHTR